MENDSTLEGPSSSNTTENAPSNDVPKYATFRGEEFKLIEEGQAQILYPKAHQVFYNPVQQYNRDMSVMMLRLFKEDWDLSTLHLREKRFSKPQRQAFILATLGIVEGLAATGLRSIRYAKEIEGLDWVLANDLDQRAVDAIHRNRDFNEVPEGRLRTTKMDASFLMHKLANDASTNSEDRCDPIAVVDLDPYGGADLFLDGALNCVADDGLLAVTCTDLAVLCGNYSESCWAKYGAMPAKRTEYCHETALRIVLASIAAHAGRHRRVIQPVLSMYADFYIRVFVKVSTSGKELKKVPCKVGYTFQCTKCTARQIQHVGKSTVTETGNVKFSQGYAPAVPSTCQHCGGQWKMGGPVWLDPIHDYNYLNRALAHLEADDAPSKYGTHKRMYGTIKAMIDELPDVPLFYTVSNLCNNLRLTTPRLAAFRSAIIRQGFRVSGSHCQPGSIKTDMPHDQIIDIMRSWHAISPAKLDNIGEGSPARQILTIPPKVVANFDILEEAKERCVTKDGKRLGRYPIHPPNWGPGTRAGRKREAITMAEDLAERRKLGQNRRKKRKTEHGESNNPNADLASTDKNAHSSSTSMDDGSSKMEE